MVSNFIQLPDSFLINPIAHRGLHDCGYFKGTENAPENSRAAIMQAMKLGFGVEIDVRISKDGVLFVVHDQNLSRLCAVDVNVSESNYCDLLQARLKNMEFLPTLDEILNIIKGNVPILIDVKSEVQDEKEELIATVICDHVKHYTGPLALMSFNWGVIIALESHDIGKPRGLVSQVFDKSRRLFISDTEKSGIPEDSLTSHGVSFISHECCNVSKDLYKINVKANRKVFTWTVCDKDMALRVRDNCDNITFEGFMP
ncbi:MAG: hypothetical protein CML37_02655 [Rhodobacteraceae bacterium]|nr:hypothetical protein [Paracoccaceae bacterium]